MSGPLDVVDGSRLIDSDWVEVNRLKRAFDLGGADGLRRSLEELVNSKPIVALRVLAALLPDALCEAIKDGMAAEKGTDEDLRDLVGKYRQHKH